MSEVDVKQTDSFNEEIVFIEIQKLMRAWNPCFISFELIKMQMLNSDGVTFRDSHFRWQMLFIICQHFLNQTLERRLLQNSIENRPVCRTECCQRAQQERYTNIFDNILRMLLVFKFTILFRAISHKTISVSSLEFWVDSDTKSNVKG